LNEKLKSYKITLLRRSDIMKYDCIIVGAGPAGTFCAYELVEKNPNIKVL
jgi:ribulose 1,5-bisphosphate synthetase/thiazole synthase